MKKRLFILMIVMVMAVAMLPAAGGPACAASPVNVTVDGSAVTFNSDLGTPYIDSSSRTMVPFRAVANFMPNIDVGWSPIIKEAVFTRAMAPATVNGKSAYVSASVRFPIGADYFWTNTQIEYADGQIIDSVWRYWTMDTKAVIKDSRTYAPIRYLAEALNYTVGWDGSTKTVVLTNEHPNTWGGYYLLAEQGRGSNRVYSEAVAKMLAREFLRAGRNDANTIPTYLGESTDRNGSTIWRFRTDATGTGQGTTNAADFYVCRDGAVYVKFSGQSSYSRWDQAWYRR